MTRMTEPFFEQSVFDGAVPVSDNANLKQHLNTPFEQGQTLRDSVEKALHNYFAHLEGADVTDVYNLAGHLYKIGAHYLLFRALVVEGIRAPYAALERSHRVVERADVVFAGIAVGDERDALDPRGQLVALLRRQPGVVDRVELRPHTRPRPDSRTCMLKRASMLASHSNRCCGCAAMKACASSASSRASSSSATLPLAIRRKVTRRRRKSGASADALPNRNRRPVQPRTIGGSVHRRLA